MPQEPGFLIYEAEELVQDDTPGRHTPEALSARVPNGPTGCKWLA